MDGKVYVFSNLKKHTKKNVPKGEKQFCYKLTPTEIHYFEYEKNKLIYHIAFNSKQFKFKKNSLNEQSNFAKQFLIKFFNSVKRCSKQKFVFTENAK